MKLKIKMLYMYVHFGFSCQCNIVICTVHTSFSSSILYIWLYCTDTVKYVVYKANERGKLRGILFQENYLLFNSFLDYGGLSTLIPLTFWLAFQKHKFKYFIIMQLSLTHDEMQGVVDFTKLLLFSPLLCIIYL